MYTLPHVTVLSTVSIHGSTTLYKYKLSHDDIEPIYAYLCNHMLRSTGTMGYS